MGGKNHSGRQRVDGESYLVVYMIANVFHIVDWLVQIREMSEKSSRVDVTDTKDGHFEYKNVDTVTLFHW